MATQGMSFLDERMIKITILITLHAQLFHDTA